MTTAAPARVPRQELRLKVGGMTCAGCAANVQRALEARPDVHSATVSVTSGIATVVGDHPDPESLVRTIQDRGYSAEPVDEAPAPEAMRAAIEQRHHAAEKMWRYRAVVGLGLWLPLEAIHWLHLLPHALMPWVMLIGSTVVLAVAGWGFYRSALAAARKGTSNMDTLIAIGATTAWAYSLLRFLLGHGEPYYFAEAAGLLGIVSLGHWFEARASARAGSALRELLEYQPDRAERIASDGSTESIPSADIRPGDRLLIRPGDRVPADGTVLEGASAVDESIVTGESVPVEKAPGDLVVAGGLNTTGRLVVESTVDGRHTTVARIADLVQRAQSSRADVQRLADRVSAVFVPVVLLIALATFVAWWSLGHLTVGVISAVTVLIISCPCALGLATPMAIMVGAGASSRMGILVKSAAALEDAGNAKAIVFDKTGTLTVGRFRVTNVDPRPGWTEEEVLRLAAAAEEPSEHPIARAVVARAREAGIDLPPASDFRAIPGVGVEAIVQGRTVRVERDDRATSRVLVDGDTVATFDAADVLRPDAPEAVRRLRELGLTVTLLSGDREEVAHAIAREAGIEPEHVIARATPESKAARMAETDEHTIMVGDGLNDAAALAAAGTGIAVASGTNVAIESADVVIPGDKVTLVPRVIVIARETLKTIRQNLFFAFLYNAAAIPAAAFGLLGEHGPLIAAVAMGLSDVTVVGNTLRLKRRLRRLP